VFVKNLWFSRQKLLKSHPHQPPEPTPMDYFSVCSQNWLTIQKQPEVDRGITFERLNIAARSGSSFLIRSDFEILVGAGRNAGLFRGMLTSKFYFHFHTAIYKELCVSDSVVAI
jgi:hypothetical protein